MPSSPSSIHDVDEREHYDIVASTFLGVSSSMVAILAGLFPFLKAQGSLNALHVFLFGVAVILLLISTIGSMISLLERKHTHLKRLSCIVTAFPLTAAIAVLLAVVLL